jgi:RimJ/RimL family protein N-acetyltransferase
MSLSGQTGTVEAGALEDDDVALRPTNPGDFGFLRSFFDKPLVHEHWGGDPPSDSDIRVNYLGGRSPAVECFIVQIDGHPGGFVQYHQADDGEGGGMDMVLLPERRGQAVGTRVVRLMVAFVQEQLSWGRFTVDPDVSNERGVIFWQRSGFVPVRVVDDDVDRQPYWLMEWPGQGL